MSKIYEGEEWKNVKTPVSKPTRAEEQARINTEYCNGRMSREEWLRRTDELSDLLKWNARGRL
jgi:hypothetical protein